MQIQNGGLLDARKADEPETDRSAYKIVALSVFGLAAVFACGYFLKAFLLEGNWESLLFCFLAGLGFLAFFLLEVFFIREFWLINIIVFGQVLAFLVLFYARFSLIFGLGALAGYLIMLTGVYGGRSTLNDMLKIKFWRISSTTLPKAIAGLALLISVISVGFLGFDQNNFFISQAAFEKFISPFAKLSIVQSFAPGFDLSLPAGELIKNIATNEIENNSQAKNLPAAVRSQLVDQTAKDLQAAFSGAAGVALDFKATASENIYRVILAKISGLSEIGRAHV